jgi:hypothetical protein
LTLNRCPLSNYEEEKTNQINYLLNLGMVTSEGSQNNVSPLLPVSSMKENLLLPLNLKVVRGL